LRRLPAGRTAAARGRLGERPPSSAHPRGLPGHGKPSTASRSAAHSPASARPLDLPWERSDARGAWGHVATTRSTCHRQRLVRHARAPPVPRHVQGRRPRSASTEACLARHTAFAGGQKAVAVLLMRAARPGLDARVLRQYIAKPGSVQPRSVRLSAAALTGPPTAAQTGVPL